MRGGDTQCHTSPPGARIPWLTVASLSIIFLILANRSLNEQKLHVIPVVLGIIGLAGVTAWVLAERPVVPRSARIATSRLVPVERRWISIVVSVVAAAGCWHWSSDNTFRVPGVACWIIAVVCWVVAWWPARVAEHDGPGWLRRRHVCDGRTLIVIGLVIAAMALGAYFRLHQIGETPLDPTSDHAEKLFDVQDVLDGKRPIFFERNTGREPLQFYVSAGLFRVMDWPTDFTSLKIGTALIGTLSILFVFLLAAELGGRLTGSLAALFYAVGTWPVEISRAGLRFPYALLSSAMVLWLLFRWLRTRDRRDAIYLGLATGMGLLGYTPFRVVVPGVCLGLLAGLAFSSSNAMRRRALADSLVVGTAALLVFLPLGRYAVEHPDTFWSRSTGRLTGEGSDASVFGELRRQLPVFLENTWNAFLGFNRRGDMTYVNAVSFQPLLDWISGALFLACIPIWMIVWLRHRNGRFGLAIALMPVLMLSSTLAIAYPLENPSVNRLAPAAPLVFTMLALPVGLLLRRCRDSGLPRFATIAGGIGAFLLVAGSGTASYHQYFVEFDYQTRLSTSDTMEIAEAIRGGTSVGVALDDVYVVDWPHWMDIRNIGIELGDFSWAASHNVVRDAPIPDQAPGRPMMLILHHEDAVRLDEVLTTFPGAVVTHYPTDVSTQGFKVVWIPASDDP